MSTKATTHHHQGLTLSEIESLIKPVFDGLILAMVIGFTLWLVLGVQIEPSSGGSHSINTMSKLVS